MILDAIWFIAICYLFTCGKQGFCVASSLMASIAFANLSNASDLLCNFFSVVALTSAIAVPTISKRVKWLLFAGAATQFISMLTNVYFEFYGQNYFLYNLPYYFYLSFPFIVSAINLAIFIELVRQKHAYRDSFVDSGSYIHDNKSIYSSYQKRG